MNICIVGSMRNFGRMEEIGRQLEKQGHKVTLPLDKSEGSFAEKATAKAEFMRHMFDNIKECDSILAVNDSPRGGMEGYIGPNTFLQLGLGMSLGKPLFALARWDPNLPYNDELSAMGINQLDLKLPF